MSNYTIEELVERLAKLEANDPDPKFKKDLAENLDHFFLIVVALIIYCEYQYILIIQAAFYVSNRFILVTVADGIVHYRLQHQEVKPDQRRKCDGCENVHT